MTPQDWLDKNGGAAKLAKDSGVHLSVLSRMLSGLQYPSFPVLWWFHQLSNGKVALLDWIRFFEARALAGETPPPSRVRPPEASRRRHGKR